MDLELGLELSARTRGIARHMSHCDSYNSSSHHVLRGTPTALSQSYDILY